MGTGTAPAFDLSQFDDEYRRQAVTTRAKPAPLPDGKYSVLVDKVELAPTQKGDPALKWSFRVTSSGPFYNRLLWKTTVISDKTMPILKEDLEVCGLRLEPFSDLQNRLGDLLDIPLEITKRTNGQYENIYFNRRLDHLDEADDIPF